MKFAALRWVLIVAFSALFATPAAAQTIPAGTYSMPDSGYSIVIEPQGDELRVNEAGKERIYVKSGSGTYEYTSQITGATYELHYRDRASVTATKVGSGNPPTLLIRRGGAAPDELAVSDAKAERERPGTLESAPPSPYLAIAERYQSRALTDKKDVQSWAFCSAAALKRSMASKDDADAYGREAAERLASISVDPTQNPCPDAIPENLWPNSSSAEAESLAQANSAQLAAAAQQSSEIAAMKAKQAADQQAYELAQAEHKAALAKAREEQELYAQQQAAYKAALAEHQRQIGAGPRRR